MFRNIKSISLGFVLMLTLSALVFGQEQFGNIEGTVKDATGAVVPNAVVTVRNVGGAGFRRNVTANDNGFFRVIQMPVGRYTLTTEAVSGFAVSTLENVQVVLGKTTQINIEVSAESKTVSVDVGVTDQPLDTTSSEISNSVSAEKIALLPKGTSFTSILKATPGTRFETKSGGFSVDGASGAENTFVIDGQEVTNYRTAGLAQAFNIPLTLVQEVQVKSSGFNAEFGGATGGVINVVTKGGNNDFHGDFGMEFVTSKLEGANNPVLANFTAGSVAGGTYTQTVEYYKNPKSKYTNWFPNATLSGPVFKDRLWFFGSYSPQIYDTQVDTIFYTNGAAATRTRTDAESYRRTRTYEYAFGRLDAAPMDNLRLSGTFLWNPLTDQGALPYGTQSFGGAPSTVNFGGTIGSLRGSELRAKQGGRQTANNVTAQAVYTPLNNVVTSFRFSRGYLNEKLGNYFIPSGTRFICWNGNTSTQSFGADACTQGQNDPANDQTIKEISIRTNYEADATYIFNAGGRHELKGGYQHQSIFNDLLKGFTTRVYVQYGKQINDDFNWTNLALPSAGAIGHATLYRFGKQGQGSNLNQAIYVQDKWQPTRRLTLNLGFRVEKEALPSFNGFDAPFSFGWGDKIAPRLGAAYDVFGDGKTKIFGSYGKFYDRLKFEMAQGSFGGNFYRVDFAEIFPNSGPFRTAFTPEKILGNFTDPIGGSCAPTGFIGSGTSRCQNDYRVASNVPGVDIEDAGGVDVNLKPYQQREFTVGMEHELSNNYVIRGRYTNKKLLNAVEDAGAISASGSEVYITGNPGQGLHAQFLEDFGYEGPYAKPIRNYNAIEVTLERRLADNYFFNANYTWSRLFGNYSGLANADENGRSSPGVNRSFDLPFIGFTASGGSDAGLLPTDRTHVFNFYGSYVANWFGPNNNTEFGVFQTFQSGTPQSTTVDFIVPIFLNERGDMGRTPMFYQTDLGITHKYKFGSDNKFGVALNVNVDNLFNQEIVTGFNGDLSGKSLFSFGGFGFASGDYPGILNAFNRGELKTGILASIAASPLNGKEASYGFANTYQGTRSVRFGFRFTF